jgi:hypothetical protein
MYTPQMVVGGREGFVGSDRPRARRSIEAALSRGTRARVALRANAGANAGEVEARYSVEGAPVDGVLTVALVEGGIVSRGPRGENAGRTLRHENVVRSFSSVRIGGDGSGVVRSGAVMLPVPPRSGQGTRSLVGYVQEKDLTIVGAARVQLGGG